MNNIKRSNARKRNNQQLNVQSVKTTFIFFKCHRSFDNSNDLISSCRDKAYNNKEFSCENLKPRHESPIMIR